MMIIAVTERERRMVKVYGVSDDLVEIEGSSYWEDEIGCYDKDVRIWFCDGTVIRIRYADGGIWQIGRASCRERV